MRRRVRLGDVCTIGRGSSPRPIKDERFFTDGIIPWVKIADATASGKYIFQTGMCVNEYGASFSRRLPPGSLILPASGTLGIPRFLGVDACVHDGWLYFYDYKGIDPEYLYYKLITLKDYYLSIAYGAAIQNINTDLVRDTEIELPPLEIQQAISSCLCSYDDLIETNRRRIALLEESARLLYREWFVNLRFPGHELVKKVDGVPEGWKQETLGDVTEAIGGATPSTNRADFWDGDIVWLTPTDVTRNDCLYLPDSFRKITISGYNGCSTKLLPAGTIFMTSRASIGFFALLDQPACTNQGFISVVPKLAIARNFFLFHLMNRVDEFESKATGTTFKELSKKAFRELQVLMPTESTLTEFQLLTEPLIEQVTTLKKQTVQLIKARDALLPKLMSGEIRL